MKNSIKISIFLFSALFIFTSCSSNQMGIISTPLSGVENEKNLKMKSEVRLLESHFDRFSRNDDRF